MNEDELLRKAVNDRIGDMRYSELAGVANVDPRRLARLMQRKGRLTEAERDRLWAAITW